MSGLYNGGASSGREAVCEEAATRQAAMGALFTACAEGR